MTRDQFQAIIPPIRKEHTACHLYEYPSSFHYEIRITHKQNNSHYLMISWYHSGIIVQYCRPHLPPHQCKKILGLHLPSVNQNYISNLIKKHLYDQD